MLSDVERVVCLAVRVSPAALSQESRRREAVRGRVPPAVQGLEGEHRIRAVRTHFQVRSTGLSPETLTLTLTLTAILPLPLPL